MYENPRREVISQLCNLTLIFTLMCRLLLSLNNMKYGQYKLSMTLLKKILIEAKVSQASYYLYYAYIPSPVSGIKSYFDIFLFPCL